MKRGFITKIRNLLKSAKFGKDSIEIVVAGLKIADEKKLDPYHFDLQHNILEDLEAKFPYDFNQMRKIIEKDIYANWITDKEKFKECGFETRPTTKAIFTCLILKLKE